MFSLSPDIIYNLSKKRLNTLLRWSLSYKDNDGVENYIIEKILENKDTLNELRKDNEIEYKYGDGKLPIILKVAENTRLNIMDGGYSSTVTGKK